MSDRAISKAYDVSRMLVAAVRRAHVEELPDSPAALATCTVARNGTTYEQKVKARPAARQLAGYGNANLTHLLANVRKSLAAKATGKASMPVFGRGDQDVVGWTEKRIEYLLSARAPAGNHRAGRIVRTVISPRAGSAGRRRSRAKAASC